MTTFNNLTVYIKSKNEIKVQEAIAYLSNRYVLHPEYKKHLAELNAPEDIVIPAFISKCGKQVVLQLRYMPL